ncbi:MAG: transglutaminase family protein [Acidiferrobacterales bacterium]|nr:transglutaminase family protein [Acidiferrobacterales bacterium]
MKLSPLSKDPSDYLQHSEYIDFNHPKVARRASELADGFDQNDHLGIAKQCFEFVRDEIKHSADHQIDTITCKASDVLIHETGFCYAKSHLLAGLLRANNIPAGLCYQRLSIGVDEQYSSSSGEPYCTHGLNAIFLPEFGWYRVDARGNKAGVNAQFSPPKEQLAFAITERYEIDFNSLYIAPRTEIVETLTGNKSMTDVNRNLPDELTTFS